MCLLEVLNLLSSTFLLWSQIFLCCFRSSACSVAGLNSAFFGILLIPM
nr:MAG TPA: hypothetical protein [Caudoviricetes sp.]